MSWWIKFIGMVAGTIMACAGAMKMLGISLDVQSKSESRSQHDQIKQELRSEQDQFSRRIEHKIDKLGDRIDSILTINVARETKREAANK